MAQHRRFSSENASRPSDSFGADFPKTSLLLLEGARASDPRVRQQAVELLTERYWKPVYSYLRRRGFQQADAADLTQDFFVKLLEKDCFAKADPQRGRFRNFLLTALRNYLVDTVRQKRLRSTIPPDKLFPLEEMIEGGAEPVAAEPDAEDTRVFDTVWLRDLVQRVLRRQQEEWACGRRELHFEIFLLRTIHPALEGGPRPTLNDLVRRFGITPRQVANLGVTAMRAFRRFLGEEIESFALNQDDHRAEYEDVLNLLRRKTKQPEIGHGSPNTWQTDGT